MSRLAKSKQSHAGTTLQSEPCNPQPKKTKTDRWVAPVATTTKCDAGLSSATTSLVPSIEKSMMQSPCSMSAVVPHTIASTPFPLTPNKQVIFRSRDHQWQAVVQENIGSFSRELRLPVVSEENIGLVLASLVGKQASYIKSRIHILDTDQAFKQVVYVGPIGLLGGGFWSCFGCAVGGALIGAACAGLLAGLAVASGGVVTLAVMGIKVGVGTFIGAGAVIGGILGFIHQYNKEEVEEQAKERARSEVLGKIEKAVDGYKEKEREIASSIDRLINKLDTKLASQRAGGVGSHDGGYEYKNRDEYLTELEAHKTQIKRHIDDLESYRKHEDLEDHDKPDIDKKIADREQIIRDIDQKISEVTQKLRDQAKGVFEQERSAWDARYRATNQRMDGAIGLMSAGGGIDVAKECLSHLRHCLHTNIRNYQTWESEPALFASDRQEIGRMRKTWEDTEKNLAWVSRLIEYAQEDPKNAANVCELCQASNEEELHEICCDFIETGQVPLLHYAIAHRKLSVNSSDRRGNTLLHQAVLHGQVETVKYLLQHGADATIANQRESTPLSYARAGGNAAIIALLEGAHQ